MPEYLPNSKTCQGNFQEVSGKCPGNVRDKSGKFPVMFRECSRKVMEIVWKFPERNQENIRILPEFSGCSRCLTIVAGCFRKITRRTARKLFPDVLGKLQENVSGLMLCYNCFGKILTCKSHEKNMFKYISSFSDSDL